MFFVHNYKNFTVSLERFSTPGEIVTLDPLASCLCRVASRLDVTLTASSLLWELPSR